YFDKFENYFLKSPLLKLFQKLPGFCAIILKFATIRLMTNFMFAKDFKKWDTILGWVSFAIAFIVYAVTVEPTGSFWDAGEYISTSAKLQVGHPPGAPLLQMIGAFFSMFAFGDNTKIALMVNSVSIVSSAFAVLFTFWAITNLSRKLLPKKNTLSNSRAIAVFASGLVGALTLVFSDS